MTKTTKQIAEIFNVDPKTVREWVDGGMPVKATGSRGAGKTHLIDLESAVRWYFSSRRSVLDAAQERARRDKEAADKLALDNARTRGELAPIAIMEEEIAALLSDMRANALGLGTKLAPTLAGLSVSEVQARIDAATHELLAAIASYRPHA